LVIAHHATPAGDRVPAVTSGRERDRRWWAAVLAGGIAELLIHVCDRLTQVTLIVAGVMVRATASSAGYARQ